MSGSTVIVGLNGALQKRFILEKSSTLVPGDVHRASQVQTGVGGKGQDVAIALSCLNYAGKLQLAQFVGSGPEGDQVYDLLKDRIGADAMSLTVRPSSHMRTCTTIVGSDVSTELVEPSGVISDKECKQLMDMMSTDKDETASALCIMGSMPPGCPPEMYADIYNKVHGPDTLCLIDSVVGLDPLLQTIAKSKTKGPAILKLNASELCRLAKVPKSSSEVGGIESQELVDAVEGFLKTTSPHGLEALTGFAITDGKHPAHYAAIDKEKGKVVIYKVSTPNLESAETLYPIGAGDTVAACTLSAWRYLDEVSKKGSSSCLGTKVGSLLQEPAKQGDDKATDQLVTALSFGLACGSASCLQEQNSIFKVDDALRLFKETSAPAFVTSHSIAA